jgi:RNA polymerase sigma-70 factor, ECF subfamily
MKILPATQRQREDATARRHHLRVVEVRGSGHKMKLDPAKCDQVLATVPSLRAFAISLCGNVDRADDLVQETLLRALSHLESLDSATNMRAWLFTILRDLFCSEYQKRRREVEDADGRYAETLKSLPEQTGRVEFEEFRAALAKLPPDLREALILVGASGFSYQDAARISGCVVGTIKSRVNRARARLAGLLAIDGVDDLGPDRATRSVFGSRELHSTANP